MTIKVAPHRAQRKEVGWVGIWGEDSWTREWKSRDLRKI